MLTQPLETDSLTKLEITPKQFQEEFLFSTARYPAMASGWGTGKTLFALLRAKMLSEKIPNNLGIIVRKEFTDLRDSTIKDWENYTGIKVDSNKEVKFPNGSLIMFRHGAELDVLKNINLGWFMMEQAEEFETDEQFSFLRGRLRRSNISYHTGFIIANTNGHNWIWKLWKNKPSDPNKYPLFEATSFDNVDNLPKDFIDDLKTMEVEAPNQYSRYVMNSWEEQAGDDYLFNWEMLNVSRNLDFPRRSAKTIIGLDTALFGEDKSAFSVIRDTGDDRWEQFRCEAYEKKDSRWLFGHYTEMARRTQAHFGVVDADGGYGDGVISSCKEAGFDIVSFHAKGKVKTRNEKIYLDARAEGYFLLKDMIEFQLFKIMDDDDLIDELLTIRFEYRKGLKAIVSKEKMRKDNIKSPDKADSLMMAISQKDRAALFPRSKNMVSPEKQTPANAGIGFSTQAAPVARNAGFGFSGKKG